MNINGTILKADGSIATGINADTREREFVEKVNELILDRLLENIKKKIGRYPVEDAINSEIKQKGECRINPNGNRQYLWEGEVILRVEFTGHETGNPKMILHDD